MDGKQMRESVMRVNKYWTPPREGNTEELGQFLGVSSHRISQLKSQGVITPLNPGEYYPRYELVECLKSYDRYKAQRSRERFELSLEAMERDEQRIKIREEKKQRRLETTTRLKKYGLTIAKFQEMFEEQRGCCDVCGYEFKDHSEAFVDHCHNTGKVRGLLCASCNFAEGLLRTPEVARSMVAYMRENALSYELRPIEAAEVTDLDIIPARVELDDEEE
jgi:Recombination endonuclease VII